ncbi:DinB family protein [Chitinophaga lutea]
MSSIISQLLKEMEQEAQTTRKFLAIVPEDKYDWKPHPKSMNIRTLSGHIAELPSWVDMAIHTDGLDFATMPYDPPKFANNKELLELFEKSYNEGRKALTAVAEPTLAETWTLRNGDQVLMEESKAEVIRHAYSQTVHHRAQLGVFLRLLDIPIPGSYGPSADEMPA